MGEAKRRKDARAHREAQLAAARALLPEGSAAGFHGEIDFDGPDMSNIGVCVIVIGEKGHPRGPDIAQAAGTLQELVTRRPQVRILLTLSGYGDDPRELHEIPEAASHVREFCRETGLNDWRHPAFQQLVEETIGVLVLCTALSPGHPYRARIVPRAEMH